MAIRLDVNLKELADNHGPKAVMDRLEDLMADATDLLDDVGASLVTSTLHRFETGTDPDGHAWKPSARATREGGQTLVDRGHLRDSITHRRTPVPSPSDPAWSTPGSTSWVAISAPREAAPSGFASASSSSRWPG